MTTQRVKAPVLILQKWGALASFLLAATLIFPAWIYLVGDLRSAIGPFAYSLADFLFGPACAMCLVLLFVVLRECLGAHAPRRMSLAVVTSVLASAMFVIAAFIRSINRQYLIEQPQLEDLLLPVWTTIVTGVIAAGWHFLGWALVLVGSVGRTKHCLPRGLRMLYLVAGFASLCVYLFPDAQGFAGVLAVLLSVWQGIVLWKTEPDAMPPAEVAVSNADHA